MKIKTEEVNGKNYALMDDQGRVLYDNDGKEFAFDAAQTYGKIQDLTTEAKQHREAKEAAEQKLQSLDGIDPSKYQEAVTALEKIDQKKLIDAGEIDKVKADIAKSYEAKLDDERTAREKLEQQYNGEKLQSSFASSKYISDNLSVPPDMAMATFRDNFKVENGQIVPYDATGNTIYSRTNPGSVADFDEAMQQIVEGYKYKDRITKASNHQGPGGNDGPGGGPARKISRQQFEGMNPAEQQKVAAEAREGKASFVE